ncbi:HipA N-terminal domain-containing protein [Caulobacter segnis]
MTSKVSVWFDALHVGDVSVADDGALSFRYSDRWQATLSVFPLSIILPVGPEAYPTESIAPWLANLLPEEQQLQALHRVLGVDRADTLAMLAAGGVVSHAADRIL